MFLFNALHLIGMGFALTWMYPFALMLIPAERRSALVLVLVTLALSLGGLTLFMLALILVGALRFPVILISLVVVVYAALIWILHTQLVLRQSPPPDQHWSAPYRVLDRLQRLARARPVAFTALGIIAGMGVLITFNALYWPFDADDAVTIYGSQARRIYLSGALPVGAGQYEAYPMLLQFSYVFSFQLAGSANEYLAGVPIAALGVGTLGAALALGKALYDEDTGILAALLLALTPMVTRWASSGLTDIPAAFFATLAVLFGWWLREHGTARDAFLFGVMGGLAAWTKNSALAVSASVALWTVYLSLRYPDHVRWDRILWCGFGGAITAGPWYLRNWIEYARLVPDTVWTEQAQHTAANLVPFLLESHFYFLPGIVLTLGLGVILFEVVRGPHKSRDRALLLLVHALPFAAAWWWAASYASRFLLVVVPLFAVMGARALSHLLGLVATSPQPLRRIANARTVKAALVIALIVLALPAARKAVSFKDELLRDPLMDDTTRHQLAVGPAYDVAVYLNELPAEGRILSSEYMLIFHTIRPGIDEVVIGEPSHRAHLAGFDYLVSRAGARLFQTIEPEDVELLAQLGDIAVYRVVYEADGEHDQ